MANKTNATGGIDDDYLATIKSGSEKIPDDVLNGYARSRLPGDQGNFHHHDSSLSPDDRERYNELNHAVASNEQHHYLNDDAMHPPLTQNIKEINALHHQHHGIVDDDAMSPPNHKGDEYYHEFIHHGNFDIKGHPVNR